MNSKLSTILTAVIILISVIAVALFAMVLMNADADPETLYGSVSPLVEYSAWLLYITLAITVVFSILTIFKQPENLKKMSISIAVLGVLFLIAYLMASDTAVLDVQGQVLEGGEAGSTSKLISAIINYSMYLGAIAIGVIGFGAVKTAVK